MPFPFFKKIDQLRDELLQRPIIEPLAFDKFEFESFAEEYGREYGKKKYAYEDLKLALATGVMGHPISAGLAPIRAFEVLAS